jgi:hypothetical protein
MELPPSRIMAGRVEA